MAVLFRYTLVLVLLMAGIHAAEVTIEDRIHAAKYRQSEQVLVYAGNLRAQIEKALNSAVYLARGLEALVVGVESPSDQELNKALARLYGFHDSIRNIGLAPANVLRYVYPHEGNEAALGLRYEDLPQQWAGVQRAMDSRSSVLVGPVDLVQGGRAIINRTPIFLDHDQYWGMISIVIDVDKLLKAAGADEIGGGVRVQVAGENANSDSVAWLLGDGRIDPLLATRMNIRVPGAEWTLLAEPVNGWNVYDSEILRMRLGLYSAAALLSLFVLLILTGRAQARVMAENLTALNDEITSANDVLEYMSRYDPLTNVANRRYFDEMLNRSWATCSRLGAPLSILMVDMDHFKKINDNYGHATGDACLVRVATLITKTLQRADDLVARFGGEEFIVMAVGADAAQADALAEKMRAAIAGTLIEHDVEALPPLRVTASVGVSTAIPRLDSKPSILCSEADKALYTAKNTGRNRVCHYFFEDNG